MFVLYQIETAIIDTPKMDQLIRRFAARTPVHVLNEHRQHMHEISTLICNELVKASQGIRGAGSEDSSDVQVAIATGSMAEGAGLARVFGHEIEFELDVLIPCQFEWTTEDDLVFVHRNPAFVHIPVNPETVIVVFGEDVRLENAFIPKEDGTYLGNFVLKNSFAEVFNRQPDLLENFCGNKNVVSKHCASASASVAIQIDDVEESKPREGEKASPSRPDFVPTEARPDASVRGNEAVAKVMSETMAREEFEVRVAEMFAHLETVQDEFTEMRRRSGEASVSVSEQKSKALEWATSCVDVADFIFDVRQPICRYLKVMIGMDAAATDESVREQLKRSLKVYIDQLAMSADSDSDTSAMCSLLSDIEERDIAPGRFLIAFRELVRMQTALFDCFEYVEQNPQLSEIPQPLQRLSDGTKRLSFDLVPCLKLGFWPSVADDWKTRNRAWPAQSVVDEIASRGTHLVGKTFCHDDIDWRLSFSVAEIELATRWSPVQHFVYFVFKSLFYKFVKPLDKAEEVQDR